MKVLHGQNAEREMLSCVWYTQHQSVIKNTWVLSVSMKCNHPAIVRLRDLKTHHFIKDPQYVQMKQSDPENKETGFNYVVLFYSWRSALQA